MCFSYVQKMETVFFSERAGRRHLWESTRCHGKVWRTKIEGPKSHKKMTDRFGTNRLSQLPFQAPTRGPDKRRDDGTS